VIEVSDQHESDVIEVSEQHERILKTTRMTTVSIRTCFVGRHSDRNYQTYVQGIHKRMVGVKY
jgi:hypothetical protein